MTAKEYVKSVIPNAYAERQKTKGGLVYFLIRERGASMYITSGYPERKAWVNAKNELKNRQLPK